MTECPKIAPLLMRRLAFTKHLYSLAMRQSQLSGQSSSASILLFHDAVELFAQAVTDERGLATPPKFLDYWNNIKDLPHRNQMKKLNRLRVDLKHHGIHPSLQDLEEARVYTRDFFDDACQSIFGISFTRISMVELVQPESAKHELGRALELLESGETKGAVERTSVALMEILNLSGIEIVTQGFLPRARTQEAREIVGWAEGKFMALRESLFFLHYDLDPRDYRLLRQLAPNVAKASSGQLQVRERGIRPPTMEEAERCIDFVVDVAMRVAEYRSGFPRIE